MLTEVFRGTGLGKRGIGWEIIQLYIHILC